MAYYQNTSVDSDKLVIGNWKIETAATVGGTYVNLGAGMLDSFSHNVEKWDIQAGNAPDPIEGVADETLTIGFTLIEYDGSALSAMQNGLTEYSATSVLSTLTAGGNQELTKRAYKLTNRSERTGSTVETVIKVYTAAVENGVTLQLKSDNDTDPITGFQFTLTAELDTTRTAGDQLFSIEQDI
jgi:hypothetical protein